MKPPKFLTTYPRFKFTLILLTLLFVGVAAKADVPCQTAIEIQDSTIKQLQNQLKTAQSVPYNQGYQEGYKVARLARWEIVEETQQAQMFTCMYCLALVAFLILREFFRITKQ